MRRLLLSALGVGVLFAGAPSFAEEKVSATKLSGNGLWAVRLRALDGGHCAVEGLKESEVSWTLKVCVGGPFDLYFPSDSGERFWVLYTLPEAKPEPREPTAGRGRRMVSADPNANVVVAKLYGRMGEVLRSRTLKELVGPAGRSKVQVLGKRFKWLNGAAGMTGKPPHTNERGQLELETVDLQQRTLDF